MLAKHAPKYDEETVQLLHHRIGHLNIDNL